MNDAPCAVDECTDQPFIQHPLHLCGRHALMVSANVNDILHATALMGHKASEAAVERVSIASDSVWGETSHPPIVYFLANGDRVKIGVSTNITARVGALSLRKGNVLILLQGGYDLESALHDHFLSDRIGRTEWFILSSRIQAYVADRQEARAALRQPVLAADEAEGPFAPVVVPAARRQVATAEQKICQALKSLSERSDTELAYVDRAALLAATSLKEGTFANALGKLETAGKIHRIAEGKNVRVGLGPADSDNTHDVLVAADDLKRILQRVRPRGE